MARMHHLGHNPFKVGICKLLLLLNCLIQPYEPFDVYYDYRLQTFLSSANAINCT
jgi:hypothetical protein